MAFPTIHTADSQSGVVTTNSSSWTLTWPTNLTTGNLILVFMACDGSPTTDLTGTYGMTDLDWVAPGSAARAHLGYKTYGSESGTFAVTLSASEQGVWYTCRVSGHQGSPFSNSPNQSGGTDAAPDPPSANPTGWDVEDTLWLATYAADHGNTAWSSDPAGWSTLFHNNSGGANGAALGIATLNSAVASVDPGTFGISASEQWCSQTNAIRPAAPATAYAPPTKKRRRWPVMRDNDKWAMSGWHEG